MMAGPTIREALISAPGSITARPISSQPGWITPRQAASAVSRTSRLTSSMSATFPVSFQHPEIVVQAHFGPPSISRWIASVISSSPCRDGVWRAKASCTAAVNR